MITPPGVALRDLRMPLGNGFVPGLSGHGTGQVGDWGRPRQSYYVRVGLSSRIFNYFNLKILTRIATKVDDRLRTRRTVSVRNGAYGRSRTSETRGRPEADPSANVDRENVKGRHLATPSDRLRNSNFT